MRNEASTGAHLLHVVGGPVRQDCRAPIDPRVAEPALRARDHALRGLGAASPGQLTHGVRPRGVPRERHGPLGRVRRVVERGQQRPRVDRGRGANEPGDVEDLDEVRGVRAARLAATPRRRVLGVG